jgi:hypothetical protein
MCERCEWWIWLDEIDSLLSEPKYKFAYPALRGIKANIARREHINGIELRALQSLIRTTDARDND